MVHWKARTIDGQGNQDKQSQRAESVASPSFSVITACLEQFLADWEGPDAPPVLSKYLPADPHIRGLALLELIKIDLEYRWVHFGMPKRLVEYQQEFPDLLATLPNELLHEERHVRQLAGDESLLASSPAIGPEGSQLGGLLDLARTPSTDANRKEILAQVDAGMLLDDFDLLTKLGEGSFGKVFLARQRSMQRIVALKVSVHRGSEPQTLAQLDHESIVRVFDQRLLHDRKLHLMYMQYLPGGTLQDLIRQMRTLAPDQRNGKGVVAHLSNMLAERGESVQKQSEYFKQLERSTWSHVVCLVGEHLGNALEHAHSHGVLHRDLKPANVLLGGDGLPKLADFNVSFASQLSGANAARHFGGSLAYMSPEQLEAFSPEHGRKPESLDARSDIFSLGIVLFELATLHRPFPDYSVKQGQSLLLRSLLQDRQNVPLTVLADRLLTHVDDFTASIVLRCLVPDQNQRWPNGGELAQSARMCRDRELTGLLHQPITPFVAWVRSHVGLSFLIFSTAVNAAAGIANFLYNYREIVLNLKGAVDQFMVIQTVINVIAYPLGLLSICWMGCQVSQSVLPEKKKVRKASQGSTGDNSQVVATTLRLTNQAVALPMTEHVTGISQKLSDSDSLNGDVSPARSASSPTTVDGAELSQARAGQRARCLLLAHHAVQIAMALWVLAGIAYPICIHLVNGHMPITGYVHFFASLLLCGLMGTSYPFLLGTWLTTCLVYPGMMDDRIAYPEDVPVFKRLLRITWIHIALVCLVPLIGITWLLIIGSQYRLAMLILCITGIASLVPSFFFFARINQMLSTLIQKLEPASS